MMGRYKEINTYRGENKTETNNEENLKTGTNFYFHLYVILVYEISLFSEVFLFTY
jgi:hypothetical protein